MSIYDVFSGNKPFNKEEWAAQKQALEPEMAKAVMYRGANAIFANENTVPTNPGIDILDQMLATGIEQKVFRTKAANTSWMIASALLGFVMSVVENQIYLLDNFNQIAEDFVEILMGGITQ